MAWTARSAQSNPTVAALHDCAEQLSRIADALERPAPPRSDARQEIGEDLHCAKEAAESDNPEAYLGPLAGVLERMLRREWGHHVANAGSLGKQGE